MITNLKDKISTGQVTITVVSMIIGVGILTIPRTAADVIGTTDVWIAIILGGFVAMGASFIIVKLSERFPQKTFYQYSQVIVGRFLGWILSLLLILYFIFFSGYEVRILAELVRVYLLDKTPIEVIIISFMGVGTYLVVGGINPMVRLFEFYFPIIALMFLTFIGLSFKNFEIDNLRPVLSQGMMPVMKGLKTTILSYLGFESMLILPAFMKYPNRAMKAVLVGIAIPTFFYFIMIVVVIGVLTVEEVKILTWPTASLAMEIDIPGGFLERFEVIFIFLWVLAIYTTFVATYYFASLGLRQLFKKDNHLFIYGLLPIIYIVAIIPPNTNVTFQMGDVISYMGVLVGGLIPISLLGVAFIRRIGYEKK
ncbi:MAG: spore germination protein [Marinisporobacter sp.]|jgi:spore germination protein|nr:spore germination protein [Marinisporobacter sp.]